MKKRVLLIMLIVLLASFALAENQNLYLYDSLQLQLDVNGGFELVPESSQAQVEKASAELLLYPQEDFRQKIINFNSQGTVEQNTVRFEWADQQLGTKTFGYSALIKTDNQRREVPRKVSFPIDSTKLKGYEQYLLPTETIDSNNPAVIAKASELVEGEDDLFKAAFKMSSWVEQNVKYDLTTLTADTSQKASWVLANKEGVCDEMTSLFVAMARSVGIPARFVSGISYTTSDLFSEPWQPHGWAEVYFPDIGWVSFDITFGEYGYIDVTHLKLRDGFDPKEPATRYEWLANDVKLEAQDLKMKTNLKGTGSLLPEDVHLEEEILSPEVSFGSYNLITGILKNNADYYAATTLQLAIPPEVAVMGRNKRTILMAPGETKETYWIVQVSSNLDKRYIYTFPALIYSEKNITVRKTFTAQTGKPIYSKQEIEKLVPQEEEKSYSRQIALTCENPQELKIGQTAEVKCTIKNTGNSNLQGINFCLNDECTKVDLPINQQKTSTISISGTEPGWEKVIVSAENSILQKTMALQYLVLDDPMIEVNVNYPAEADFGSSFEITLDATKKSLNSPRKVVITVRGLGKEQEFKIDKLKEATRLTSTFDGNKMTKMSTISIIAKWENQDGKAFSMQKEIVIRGKATSFLDSIKMFWNRIVNVF